MPPSQRDSVLSSNLGPSWRDLFSDFSELPMAAASIGQVHAATLASSSLPVAVKIQYPGVATSISSDLNNLAVLLTASRLLPRGLYLDKAIANARIELGWECDYVREAECAKRFAELLKDDHVFRVPRIVDEACGPQVLTMERMWGVGATKLMGKLTQKDRDFIGTELFRLCIREFKEFRFMQTDPNWTNFLWNAEDKKVCFSPPSLFNVGFPSRTGTNRIALPHTDRAPRFWRLPRLPRTFRRHLLLPPKSRRARRPRLDPRPLAHYRLPYGPRIPRDARRPHILDPHARRTFLSYGTSSIRLCRPDHHVPRARLDSADDKRKVDPPARGEL